jgi:hypothetical protein
MQPGSYVANTYHAASSWSLQRLTEVRVAKNSRKIAGLTRPASREYEPKNKSNPGNDLREKGGEHDVLSLGNRLLLPSQATDFVFAFVQIFNRS